MARVADPVAKTRRRLRIGEGIEGAVAGAFGLLGRAVAQKLQGKQMAEAERRKNELALKMMGIEHANKAELQELDQQFKLGINQGDNQLKRELAEKGNALKRENTLEGHQVEMLLAKWNADFRLKLAGIKARSEERQARQVKGDKLKNIKFDEATQISKFVKGLPKDEMGNKSILTGSDLKTGNTQEALDFQFLRAENIRDQINTLAGNIGNKQEAQVELDTILSNIERITDTTPDLLNNETLLNLNALKTTVTNFGQSSQQAFNRILGKNQLLESTKNLGRHQIERQQSEESLDRTNKTIGTGKDKFNYSIREPALFDRDYTISVSTGGKTSGTPLDTHLVKFKDPSNARIFANLLDSLSGAGEASRVLKTRKTAKGIQKRTKEVYEKLIQDGIDPNTAKSLSLKTLTDNENNSVKNYQSILSTRNKLNTRQLLPVLGNIQQSLQLSGKDSSVNALKNYIQQSGKFNVENLDFSTFKDPIQNQNVSGEVKF